MASVVVMTVVVMGVIVMVMLNFDSHQWSDAVAEKNRDDHNDLQRFRDQ